MLLVVGRHFLYNGLATSSVLNHLFVVVKPVKAKFNLNLDSDENIKDLILAMKGYTGPHIGLSFP